jgi:hypothetical protein
MEGVLAILWRPGLMEPRKLGLFRRLTVPLFFFGELLGLVDFFGDFYVFFFMIVKDIQINKIITFVRPV